MPPAIAVRNTATGAVSKAIHHCGECKKVPTQRCYDKYHIANCEAPSGKSGAPCGVKFTVNSRGGCLKHEYHNGFNLRFIRLRRGQDPDLKSRWELEQEAKAREEQKTAAAAAALAAEAEFAARDPNTDWHRHEKGPAKTKTKNKQRKN
ncbi:hypothetical protein K504DRAFT_498790 [Pleomassaria siparia CBS 279.74]|uniref:Uncharacterized protein n=1 Tax=Pleomassaria siparia CBS 279.74 TaxID=1314801 RepID=A0A6G1KN74_9PLEO|nr:hypothetical protein K504DRAFT_498790 [Pleomassaria siparia CBS 279.74]